MFLSGMKSPPCHRPCPRSWRLVSNWVPTNCSVVFRASCFALLLAQATVPHKFCPHGAMLMMLFPPGLRHFPCTDGCATACPARLRIKAIGMGGALPETGALMEIAALRDDFDIARMAGSGRSPASDAVPLVQGRRHRLLAQMLEHLAMVLKLPRNDVDHVAVRVALDDPVHRDQPRAHHDL